MLRGGDAQLLCRQGGLKSEVGFTAALGRTSTLRTGRGRGWEQRRSPPQFTAVALLGGNFNRGAGCTPGFCS